MKKDNMKECILIGIACIIGVVFSVSFSFWVVDRPAKVRPAKVEEQKVIRGEIIYKGETISVILREGREPK